MAFRIPLAKPEVGATALPAFERVLASGYFVQGAEVEAFEEALTRITGRCFAIAVSSGTSALALSLQALEIGEGHRVAVPALSWPSPLHAVKSVGAEPVLVDVDGASWNLPAHLEDAVDCVIGIDQFGAPLAASWKEYGGKLIEDAACAIGSTFADGSACGSLGALSTLSFHPRKILTTGEGGAVLTDSAALAKRVRRLRNHGQSAPGVFPEPGLNWRMSEFQAALGRAQLDALAGVISRRRAIRDIYLNELSPVSDVVFQRWEEESAGNAQTMGMVVSSPALAERVMAHLHGCGIQCGRLSYALSKLEWSAHILDRAPMAERIEACGLALPMYSGLRDAQVVEVAAEVRNVLG